jgi:hypothetical protein
LAAAQSKKKKKVKSKKIKKTFFLRTTTRMTVVYVRSLMREKIEIILSLLSGKRQIQELSKTLIPST